MKRILSLCILSLFLLCTLCISVFAHPGKTDSDGGHWDKSTGEYHWHHGYPAHQHIDLDGDGVLDCPYDFDDQTDHSSRQSSKKKSRSEAEAMGKTVVTTEVIPSWVYGAFFAFAVLILFLMRKSYKLSERNRQLETEKARAEAQTAKTEADCKKEVERLRAETEEAIKKCEKIEHQKRADYLYLRQHLSDVTEDVMQICAADVLKNKPVIPDGDYIDGDMLPCSSDDASKKWGQKYTFYIGSRKNGAVTIHTGQCQYAYGCQEINAHTINKELSQYHLCRICNPHIPDTNWVKQYIAFVELLERFSGKPKE